MGLGMPLPADSLTTAVRSASCRSSWPAPSRFGLIAFVGAPAVAAGLNIFGYVLAQDDSSSAPACAWRLP